MPRPDSGSNAPHGQSGHLRGWPLGAIVVVSLFAAWLGTQLYWGEALQPAAFAYRASHDPTYAAARPSADAIRVTNTCSSPVKVGEIAAGNLRFINSAVLQVEPTDEDDLIAADALRAEVGPVPPGEKKTLVIYAGEAMWETQRMSTMIKSPDAKVATLPCSFGKNGQRDMVEIGGPMIPVFG